MERVCSTEVGANLSEKEPRRTSWRLAAALSGMTALMMMGAFAGSAGLEAQTPKRAPLMTKWAKDVDPANPLPEYPRPQMVRREWLNLNGVWELQSGLEGDVVPAGKKLGGQIIVPYPVESALSGVMLHFNRLWYRRTFTVPHTWDGRQIIVHFGAVDYESEVYINGKSVGVHKGGYDPFSYDITPYLTQGGPQEIIVRVYDPTELGGQPRGKQTNDIGGIMYTPTTGIWQTVWMEPVESRSIRDLKIVPDVDRKELHLTVNTTDSAKSATVNIVVEDGDKVVKKFEGKANAELDIPIADPKLWSPDHPFLYGLKVSLTGEKATSDTVSSYFGMRKIEIGKVGGFNRILLNHEYVFERGPLDQGFWPDGIYTAPTDDALKSDIETMKALGFNMVRKHIKVEPARWYYWTDKLGLLVWQDMPSADSYPWNEESVPPVDKAEFESELQRMVETHWNSPSIISWTIFNEAQGQYDSARLADMVKKLDPSRLVNEASGGNYTESGDLNDLHQYPEPGVRSATAAQALVNGEYGGIGYQVPGHTWRDSGDTYTNVATSNDLLYLYAEYISKVKKLDEEKGLSATVYTELTDVMTEINGLMTYDRILKVPAEKIYQANHGTLPMPNYKVVVPTSEKNRQTWRYSTTVPAASWAAGGFDDGQWTKGAGGFGEAKDGKATSWTTHDIWMRRHFNAGSLTTDQLANLVAKDFHHGDVEIYINGVLAYSQGGDSDSWEHRGLSTAARVSVHSNADNVLAVHCVRGEHDQFVDVGLDLRVVQ
jgi:hypothetical protein